MDAQEEELRERVANAQEEELRERFANTVSKSHDALRSVKKQKQYKMEG